MTGAAATLPDPTQGLIEPHAGLLKQPPQDTRLYKVMSVENFLRSVAGGHLYFNRVDSYRDFSKADRADGEQLAEDRETNREARFDKNPGFSLADYYDRSRARTYACCFSLENSDYIWREYGDGGSKGKVGVVFDFAKLRTVLNETLKPGSAALQANGEHCRQIFSVNYGVVEYVNWGEHRANRDKSPNPIIYTYLKDKEFSKERELRVSLSALGIGHFVLADGSPLEFPAGLQLDFRFGAAIADGTITEILYGPGCDTDFICAELRKLGIATSKDGALPGRDEVQFR
jgi:hypothetical protein